MGHESQIKSGQSVEEEISPEFRPYTESAVVRLQYLYPGVTFERVGQGEDPVGQRASASRHLIPGITVASVDSCQSSCNSVAGAVAPLLAMVNVRAMELVNLGVNGTTWVQPKSLHEVEIREQPVGQVFNSITNGDGDPIEVHPNADEPRKGLGELHFRPGTRDDAGGIQELLAAHVVVRIEVAHLALVAEKEKSLDEAIVCPEGLGQLRVADVRIAKR